MKVCTVDNCSSASIKRGYCQSHYKRWWRHGDPLAGRGPRPPNGEPQRFVDDVALNHKGDDCLLWPYGKQPSGYGKITIEGDTKTASSYVCECAHGPAPTAEHESAHSCGNRPCVSPHHLSWKTAVENNADKLGHGTHNRGERHNLAKLTEDDVRTIRALRWTVTERELADRYGVTNTAIHLIHERKNWSWLEDERNAA
jgi:hypothetical protein